MRAYSVGVDSDEATIPVTNPPAPTGMVRQVYAPSTTAGAADSAGGPAVGGGPPVVVVVVLDTSVQAPTRAASPAKQAPNRRLGEARVMTPDCISDDRPNPARGRGAAQVPRRKTLGMKATWNLSPVA